ncbi:MAG: hypothetical protein MI861_22845, partial [Pirellulales bacterium]|nr:hypothetical protein [Pirellulales bacterium]
DGSTVHIWEDAQSKVTGVAFSPDSGKLVSAANDALRVYDVESKEVIDEARQLSGAHRVRFLGHRRCVVTKYPGELLIWDLEQSDIASRFTGHSRKAGTNQAPLIWCMDVSHDGKQLATGDVTGQVYVWPLPATEEHHR